MKIQIIKEVYSGTEWRKEGDIIVRGIGIEYKEEKIVKETKEAKAPKKRITKAKK